MNDGSPDNSILILEKYAKFDSRIKIVSRLNGGLSAARNTGLEHASGQYIGFFDSDDWCRPDMYEKLQELIEQFDVDFSMCAIMPFDDIKQSEEPGYLKEYFSLGMFSSELANKKLAKDEIDLFNFTLSAWNKLYKREYLEKNYLRFQEGVLYEDVPFFIDNYFVMNSFAFTHERLYYYRINRDGSIMSDMNKGREDNLKFLAYWYKRLKKDDAFLKNELFYWQYAMEKMEWVCKQLSVDNAENFYCKMRNFIFERPLSKENEGKSLFVGMKLELYKRYPNYKDFKNALENGIRYKKIFRIKFKKGKIRYYLGKICLHKKKCPHMK